jgi:hypothetical protein
MEATMKTLSVSLMLLALALCGSAQAAVYQKNVSLTCSGTACQGLSAIVPANKTLTVDTMSCGANVAAGATVGAATVSIQGSGSFSQSFSLKFVYTGFLSNGVERIPITVGAGKRLYFTLLTPGGQTIHAAACSVRGTLK